MQDDQQQPEPVRYTTHPTVVAGVAVLAIIAMMLVFFWAAIAVLAAWDPPLRTGTGSNTVIVVQLSMTDYLSDYRSFAASAVALVATAVIWPAVIKAYKDEP